jgi:hypothetical protein
MRSRLTGAHGEMTARDEAAPAPATAYLSRHYASVPGFSSLLSAEVAVALLDCQRRTGIGGHVGEIGVLMGRSFIALALAAGPRDLCLAIDDFGWPEHVRESFLRNCQTFGVDMTRLVTITANTTTLAPADIRARLSGGRLRYLHVDGGHTADVLRHDLALAREIMAPGGIICLDDMLHAQYPELGAVVGRHLEENPELRVFCVVDRADLIAAAKFLICDNDYAERYQAALRTAFAAQVFPAPAEFAAGPALILSKDASLVPHYRDPIERPASKP